MGLDLCVEGRAKPGHEAEWEAITRKFFADEELSESEIDRFQVICEPGYASIGAPRVGTDPEADDWIAERMADQMTREQAIAEFDGYYALDMIECDGLPRYTHAGLYDGVDETSFRGKWLEDCILVLSADMIDEAWEHRMPDEAEAFGKALLAAAENARNGKTQPFEKPSLFKRLFGNPPQIMPLEEQIDVVDTAGRWFVFWGARGHPIRAYF